MEFNFSPSVTIPPTDSLHTKLSNADIDFRETQSQKSGSLLGTVKKKTLALNPKVPGVMEDVWGKFNSGGGVHVTPQKCRLTEVRWAPDLTEDGRV